MLLYIYQVKPHKAELVYTVVSGQCSALKLIQTVKFFLLQTSECSVLEGETLSTGASFSSFLALECLRGGTGLIVWVIANEMGRSLSRMFSCMDRDYKND